MQENLRQKLRNYNFEDIFNCNEMNLFWKLRSSRTIRVVNSNLPMVIYHVSYCNLPKILDNLQSYYEININFDQH